MLEKLGHEIVHDENYWSKYYSTRTAPEEASNFAQYVVERYAKVGQFMIELGCGNGRDARYFADNGVNVDAIDLCESEIEELNKNNGYHTNLQYRAGDFTSLEDTEDKYDLIYSRFTLHSVNAISQKSTLEWSARNLASDGRLCIETRGQKNELYRRGEPVSGEIDAYNYEGHYRRFVEFEDFKEEVTNTGLHILEAKEQKGFAPFKDTDYHFIRVIAEPLSSNS